MEYPSSFLSSDEYILYIMFSHAKNIRYGWDGSGNGAAAAAVSSFSTVVVADWPLCCNRKRVYARWMDVVVVVLVDVAHKINAIFYMVGRPLFIYILFISIPAFWIESKYTHIDSIDKTPNDDCCFWKIFSYFFLSFFSCFFSVWLCFCPLIRFFYWQYKIYTRLHTLTYV